MKKIVCLFALSLHVYFGNTLYAQLTDLPVIHDTLYSDVLKEKRPLEIVLPAGYDPKANKKYEVLYITDGEYTTKIVSSFVQFLGIQFLPPIIVVSVPNTSLNGAGHRERDMLPTHVDGVNLSGGAGNFVSFFKNELMPYVNKQYSCNGSNTLYGSSFAGVFTMYTLLTEPTLFQSYLLADPALWWDNGYLLKLAKEKMPALSGMPISLLITGREGPPLQYMGVANIDTVLRTSAPASLRWKVNVYNDETHNSMIFRTVYDGLKYVYYGYSNESLDFHPMNGIIIKDRPVKIHCGAELLKDIRYTTDGSEPLLTSPKVDSETITLTGSASLTVKAFCNRPAYSKTATGKFVIGEALPAGALARKAKPGGLHYAYYEGEWDSLPDFKKLKPVKAGLVDKDFDISKLPQQKNFAIVQEGQIEIQQDGYYLFGANSDGGTTISLGKQVMIREDGIHENEKFRSFIIPLVKGFYPIRISYFHKQGNPSLGVYYGLAGGKDLDLKPIPVALAYSGN